MEILDKLVLPISGNNLELLHYLLFLAQAIFMIYAGILFGSLLLSYVYNKQSEGKKYFYPRLARDYISIITDNAAYPFGLGIFPFMSIIFMYQQLLHGTGAPVVPYLIISFLLFLLALWLIQLYKFSLHMKSMFGYSLKKAEPDDKDFNYRDIQEYKLSSEKVNSTTAIWGLLLLFLSIIIFIGASALSYAPARWEETTNLFLMAIDTVTIVKFLHFSTAAFALTGAAFITKVFFWDKERVKDEEYEKYAKKLNGGLALFFIVLQPLFFAVNISITPDFALSWELFVFALIALALAFFAAHVFYGMIRYEKYKTTSFAFFLTLLLFAFIFIKDQDAFATSNKSHVETLASNYIQHEEELLAASGRGVQEEVDGGELYNTKCTACHAFDRVIQGPPHKEVLPKYIGKPDALTDFILNPVKVNPDYPAMPAQGLSPREAKAVAEYMLQEFGPKVNGGQPEQKGSGQQNEQGPDNTDTLNQE